MRNAAALAERKNAARALKSSSRRSSARWLTITIGVIYADPLCQRLLFRTVRTATPVLCRSQCRAADRARRKRRRDER
jgi:hypothetical protein